MSVEKVQEFKMANVFCNQVAHQGEYIRTLCLNLECQEISTLCSKCLINSHPQCRNQVKELEVIPKQLLELQQLQLDVFSLKEKTNSLFKELLSQIELILLPILKYQDSPNFPNLNGIGFLLKKLPKKCLIQFIDETKIKIQMLMQPEQYTNIQFDQGIIHMRLLEKTLIDQQKQQKQQKQIECSNQTTLINPQNVQSKLNQELSAQNNHFQVNDNYINDENSSIYWYWKGIALHWQSKHNEAIECFDQALVRNPYHSGCWYQKGLALSILGKYDESIDCYHKAIQINPKDKYYWNNHGQTLSKIGKLKESTKYYEEALKLDPNYIKAQQNLEKVRKTLKNSE